MTTPASLPLPPTHGGAPPSDLPRLAELIRLHTPYDAEFPPRLPGVAVARSTRVHGQLQHSRLFGSTPSRNMAQLREPGGQRLATL